MITFELKNGIEQAIGQSDKSKDYTKVTEFTSNYDNANLMRMIFLPCSENQVLYQGFVNMKNPQQTADLLIYTKLILK